MPVFKHKGLQIDTDRMEVRYGKHSFNAAGTLHRYAGRLVPIPRDAFRRLDFSRISGAELFEEGAFMVIETPQGDHIFMRRE